MKLLILSPVFPDAPSDGDRLRLHHWIEELGRRHELHLACFSDPARAADQGPGTLGRSLRSVHKIPLPRWRQRLAALLRLASSLPTGVAAAQDRRMARLMDSLIAGAAAAGRPFDGVLAYRLKMAPYALRHRGPRFLDYTDSMTRYSERRAAAATLARKRPGMGLLDPRSLRLALEAAWLRVQSARLAAFEARCAGEFDLGFFNAVQDRDAVAAMRPSAARNLSVAANGVDSARFRRPASARRDPLEMLFVGHLAYPPNADAVLWFADAILPLIRAREPRAFLTVVGSDAPPAVAALREREGVVLAGFAADTRPLLWRAAVSVCPVRSGAGRQNKLLEAFAAGLPAVSTTLAAQGAEAVAGRELLVADEPQAFADAVFSLMKRPALGRGLATRAAGLVRRRYVWAANAAAMERAMDRACQRPLW